MTPSASPPPDPDTPRPHEHGRPGRETRDTGTKAVVAAGLACLLGLSYLIVQYDDAPREAATGTPAASSVMTSSATASPATTSSAAPSSAPRSAPPPPVMRRADFAGIESAPDVHLLADWVAASDDARGHPYAIVDKRRARLYLFDGGSRLHADSPVLLGAARGDDSVPGIGERPIAQVKPHERTTPAGRFPAEPGHNAGGEDIIWVDYDAAVSMHRVRASNRAERRLQRLASATSLDNRISYGCINIPAAFYDTHVKPLLTQKGAMIYVLPEVRGMADVFGADEVAMRAGIRPASIARAGTRQGA